MRFLLILILVLLTHAPIGSDAYVCQNFGSNGHVGVDYCISTGQPVYAVLDGTVIHAVEDSRVYGRHVRILHDDGYVTLYAHLNELKVKENDQIAAGTIIGLSGGDPHDNIDGDGWSGGPHLHFEVRVPEHHNNNLYNVDPIEWLEERADSCYYRTGQFQCF